MSDHVDHHGNGGAVRHRRIMPWVGLGLIILLGYGAYGHVERGMDTRALAQQRYDQVPDVHVMAVHVDHKPVALSLPGETAPQETAAIAARASGYVEKRFVDIGTPVKAGQVLAIIKAPELDRQVAQAQATLAQARANLDLARVRAHRSGGLVGGGAVSRQDFDTDRITQAARKAEQAAADAALAETAQRRDYTTIKAPFNGVVTVRNVEAGDLVSADSPGGAPLFVVARTDTLRVRVHVPQENAPAIAEGTPVTISVPDRPDMKMAGKVTRTGFSLERGSRMLPVEIEIDNADNRLAAGLYTMVHFAVPRTTPTIMIPAEALIYGADGLSVATVDPAHHVRLHKVVIGRDFGDTLEVLSGLNEGENLIIHPPSSFHDGTVVHAVQDQPPEGA